MSVDQENKKVMELLQEQSRQIAEAKQALQRIVRMENYWEKTTSVVPAIDIAAKALKKMADKNFKE
jgi:hypothetical protein